MYKVVFNLLMNYLGYNKLKTILYFILDQEKKM